MTDTPVGPVAEAVEAAEAAEAVEAAAAEPPARAAVWTVHAAPIGPLLLVATREGLAHVVFHAEGRTVGRALARAAAVLDAPPLPWEPPAAEADGARHLRTAVAELERYFAGAREPFSVPLDWSLTGGFHERVLRELAAGVPYGHTVGYQDLAVRVGEPGAARGRRGRHGRQSAARRRALPPGAGELGRAGRVRGRPRHQAGAADAGGDPARTPVLSQRARPRLKTSGPPGPGPPGLQAPGPPGTPWCGCDAPVRLRA